MRTLALLLTATVLVLTAQAAPAPLPKADTGKDDLKRMQGAWDRVGITVGGRASRAGGLTARIAGTRLTWLADGKPMVEWALTLDGTRTPRAFDGVPLGPGGKARPWRGIYRLEGDTLTVCYHQSKRPTDFTRPRPGVWVEVFKRLKKR
jgi:uncharacterized protein (TIGR03067 family)